MAFQLALSRVAAQTSERCSVCCSVNEARFDMHASKFTQSLLYFQMETDFYVLAELLKDYLGIVHSVKVRHSAQLDHWGWLYESLSNCVIHWMVMFSKFLNMFSNSVFMT